MWGSFCPGPVNHGVFEGRAERGVFTSSDPREREDVTGGCPRARSQADVSTGTPVHLCESTENLAANED